MKSEFVGLLPSVMMFVNVHLFSVTFCWFLCCTDVPVQGTKYPLRRGMLMTCESNISGSIVKTSGGCSSLTWIGNSEPEVYAWNDETLV